MPHLPWTRVTAVDPEHEYVVMATRFVANRRHLVGIMGSTQQLWQSLPTTPGLAGYAFDVSPVRGTLSTLTAWHDRRSLATFVRGQLHDALVASTDLVMKESLFADWTARGVDVPPTWDAANERLSASRSS